MREFLVRFFGTTAGSCEITLFSVWHIMYMLLIAGGAFVVAFYCSSRSEKEVRRVQNILACGALLVYIADFFIMPLARADFSIDIDKLPFHLCTALSVVVPFVQFNERFSYFKEPVMCLSVVASLMYIAYPGSALGGVSPWCYAVIQTFLFHGLLFTWGFLHLTSKTVVLSFRNIWKEGFCILCVIAWAALGNVVYSSDVRSYDWFFITGSTFPFVPKGLMPLTVFSAVFGMCALICAIDRFVLHKFAKRESASAQKSCLMQNNHRYGMKKS